MDEVSFTDQPIAELDARIECPACGGPACRWNHMFEGKLVAIVTACGACGLDKRETPDA